MQSMLEFYADQEPNAQSTIDIFKDEWISILPDALCAGSTNLFDDPRIAWVHSVFNICGKSVLELGPLEGGHTFTLHNLGANTVTSIEGNSARS